MNNSSAQPATARLDRTALLLLAGIVLASAILLLWRLDSPLLWQDEAETANIARNLLRFGEPTPWDGEHLVTQQAGRDSVRVGGRLLWAWHPWTQHVLAAAGLAWFEERLGPTAAARLPFALIGLLTVPLVYAWRRSVAAAGDDSGDHRSARAEALVATAIYGLSIAFVLYARQCRYYPLLFLGGLLALWAYARLGADRPGRGIHARTGRGGAAGLARASGLGCALALVFYANPLSGIAFAAGFGLHALLHRRTEPARLRCTILAGCLFALLAAPWLALVLLSDVRSPDLGFARRALLFVSELWRFQYTLLPLTLWPALAWIWWRQRHQGRSNAPRTGHGPAAEIGLLAVLAGVMLVAVSVEAPVGTARYLLPLWPLCAAVLAGLWSRLRRRSVLAGRTFLVVLLGTNLFASLPALPVTVALTATGHTVPTAYDRQAPPLDKLARLGRPGSPLLSFLASRARVDSSVPGPIRGLVGGATTLTRPPRAIVAAYGWESLHFYLHVPAVGPDLQRAARDHLDLPQLDPARIDLVIPRRGWPPPARPPETADFVRVPGGIPDDAYENLPDLTGVRFGPSRLPEMTVLARESLLPPRLKSHATGPAANTSTSDTSGKR